APIVSGAVALLLQQNPELTPNLVKSVLQYTSQMVPGYSILSEGLGEINIEGAVRLSGALTQSIAGLRSGDLLMPCVEAGQAIDLSQFPTESSTIASETVNWVKGIYPGYNRIVGGEKLFTTYQTIYDTGFSWTGSQALEENSALQSSTVLLT